MAKGLTRLDDEHSSQTKEINNALRFLLDESIKENKNIQADLKEDTSYLLYLMYLKLGLIEQIDDDLEYKYDKDYDTRIVTKEEQLVKLKRIKEIRQHKNPETLMHKVEFKPSQKYIFSYQEKESNSNEENKEYQINRKILKK